MSNSLLPHGLEHARLPTLDWIVFLFAMCVCLVHCRIFSIIVAFAG